MIEIELFPICQGSYEQYLVLLVLLFSLVVLLLLVMMMQVLFSASLDQPSDGAQSAIGDLRCML